MSKKLTLGKDAPEYQMLKEYELTLLQQRRWDIRRIIRVGKAMGFDESTIRDAVQENGAAMDIKV